MTATATLETFRQEVERGLALKEAQTRFNRTKQMVLWGEATIVDLQNAKAALLALQEEN